MIETTSCAHTKKYIFKIKLWDCNFHQILPNYDYGKSKIWKKVHLCLHFACGQSQFTIRSLLALKLKLKNFVFGQSLLPLKIFFLACAYNVVLITDQFWTKWFFGKNVIFWPKNAFFGNKWLFDPLDRSGPQSCFRTFCLGANFLPIYEKKHTLSQLHLLSHWHDSMTDFNWWQRKVITK